MLDLLELNVYYIQLVHRRDSAVLFYTLSFLSHSLSRLYRLFHIETLLYYWTYINLYYHTSLSLSTSSAAICFFLILESLFPPPPHDVPSALVVVPTNHLQFVSHTLVSWLYSYVLFLPMWNINLSSVNWCEWYLK